MVLTGICYLIAGRLVDRFGPRIVQTVGALFIGLAYLLMSTVSSFWQYYLYYGVILSIGMSCMVVPLLSTVARWFTKGRGLATGIVMSGIGIGIVIMPQVANSLISRLNWRTSFLILGIVALVLITLFAQLLRRAPDQRNIAAEDTKKTTSPNVQVQGLPTKEAMRTRQFLLLCLMSFILGYSTQSMMVHIVAHTTDIGFSAIIAATVLSAIGLVSIFAKIFMGSLADRIGNRNALIIVFILMALAFVWLKFSGELWMLYLAAIIFSLGYSGSSATHSPIMAEFFGLRSHGTLYGFNQFLYNIGGALGPFIAGYIFDTNGSYQWAFLVCAVLGVIGLIISILLQPIHKPAQAEDQVKNSI